MSLTTDDGADDGWADEGSAGAGAPRWTANNNLFDADYPGGYSPADPASSPAPAGNAFAAAPTNGAAPTVPNFGAGVSTAILPTTIDRTLTAPVGALTRDHVLDQAGDMLAGLPPELFGRDCVLGLSSEI